MEKFFLKRCLVCILSGFCLVTHPLMGEDNMPSQKNMMMMQQMMTPQEMNENDLLNQMNESDKAVYQKLNVEGKALVLKMANTAKMKHPMMMMQKCMMMMDEMMSKMKNMSDKMDTMEMKK